MAESGGKGERQENIDKGDGCSIKLWNPYRCTDNGWPANTVLLNLHAIKGAYMCLHIYSPGRQIEIRMLHEDIYPTWRGKVIHVFTLLLKNCNDNECETIHLLYPNCSFAGETEIHEWYEGDRSIVRQKISSRFKDATFEFVGDIDKKDGDHNWHYVDQLIKGDEIHVGIMNYIPGPDTSKWVSGKIAQGNLEIIQENEKISIEESIALLQIGYSIFVYKLSSPIAPCGSCWLRLVFKPPICAHEYDINLRKSRYFREEISIPYRIFSPSEVKNRFKGLIEKLKKSGRDKTLRAAFGLESKIIKEGFELQGTTTRVRDWRINLLGNLDSLIKRIRIDDINYDFSGISPSVIFIQRSHKLGRAEKFLHRYRNPTYDRIEWVMGYEYNWKNDAFEVAKKLCGYLSRFGNCPDASKSKFEIGRALEDLPHDFSSLMVDKLVNIGFLLESSKEGQLDKLYYIEEEVAKSADFEKSLVGKLSRDVELAEIQKKAEAVFIINYMVRWRNILYPILLWITFFLSILAIIIGVLAFNN